MSPMQKYTPTKAEALDSREVAKGDTITISEHDDVVFIMGKTAKAERLRFCRLECSFPLRFGQQKSGVGTSPEELRRQQTVSL